MLKKIRALTEQYAIPATFIAYILIDLLLLGLGRLLSSLPKTLPMEYLGEVILILVPIAIVFFFGFSRAFKNGNFFRGLYCCLPFLLLQLTILLIFFSTTLGDPEANWKPWRLIVFGVFSIIGVGIREECIYRATLQNIVAKKHANSVKGIWLSAIIGAVIFGVTHISNLFYGMNPIAVLSQVISATTSGLLLGAVYLRSGSLWALILIHTVTDVAGLAQSTFLRGISDIEEMGQYSISLKFLIVRLIYVGLAAFLLRPSKCKQIYESLCFASEESDASAHT